MKEESEFLTHPILFLSKQDISFNDNCKVCFNISNYKTKKHLYFEDKILIFHCSGFYFYTVKPISKKNQLYKTFGLVNLRYIKLTSTELILIFDKERGFVIKNTNIFKLFEMSILYFNQLFSHPFLPLEVEKSDDIHVFFNNDYSLKDVEYHAPEVFLSCALEKSLDLDKRFLDDAYNFLNTRNSTLKFLSDVVNSPCISFICKTLYIVNEYEEVIFNCFDFSTFVSDFLMLICLTRNLTNLIFNFIDFKNIREFSSMSCFTHISKVVHLSFKQCNFSYDDSYVFFKIICKFDILFESLVFDNCSFSDESLTAIFAWIFISPCFHSLNSLSITCIKNSNVLMENISMLFSCGWVLCKKCIKEISIDSCNISVSDVISRILQCDTGLETVSFRNGDFTQDITISSYNRICCFDLSSCTFRASSLLSFIKLFNNQKKELSLKISAVKMSDHDWKLFYDDINDIIIPGLKCFHWSDNVIRPQFIESFVSFIMSQDNIIEIDISNCIKKKDKGLLKYLESLVSEKQFEVFKISSVLSESLGPELYGTLERVVRNGKIRILEFNNQAIGDEILGKIVDALPITIESVSFDGFMPSSFDSFDAILKRILSKSFIHRIKWPSNDSKLILGKYPPSMKEEISRKLEEFKNAICKCINEIAPIRKRNSLLPKSRKRRNKLIENMKPQFYSYNVDSKNIIFECRDLNGVDPLGEIVDVASRESELDYLIGRLTAS